MIDMEKFAKRLAALRRERGYTGEGLAQRLQVSPQAVSKWENGRCLPETAILPELAKALDCSIDSLLLPGELLILEAVYTDGQTQIPVTQFVNSMVRDSRLNIRVSTQLIGVALKSDRLKLLTVKYQTPGGIYYSFALQNENFVLDKESIGFSEDTGRLRVIGAYYGNEKSCTCVMGKLEHYQYFKWDRIMVNHETFPSDTASDDTEYLTLIYLNPEGIQVVSCPENETLYYGENRTRFVLRDHSGWILKDIMRLAWEKGMECPWAGSLYAALRYLGEPYTYQQIMGMSGACYRICFTDVWDFSCTDALVAFDYLEPLSKALGYAFRMADRLEKQERKAERMSIMEDIQNGRPVLAINLRVAPEWGIITGYTDGGSRFLCRTYFDKEVFDALEAGKAQNPEEGKAQNPEGRKAQNPQESRALGENGGYLFSDFWPFLILHFGKKKETPPPLAILKASLEVLVRAFHAGKSRGYYQGREAYEAWMRGLLEEADFDLENDREKVLRRLSVNDNMLCHLIDSRQAAACWLKENIALLDGKEKEALGGIAKNCQKIADMALTFREKVGRLSACEIQYNTICFFGADTPVLRREQAKLLGAALKLEEESSNLAGGILEME